VADTKVAVMAYPTPKGFCFIAVVKYKPVNNPAAALTGFWFLWGCLSYLSYNIVVVSLTLLATCTPAISMISCGPSIKPKSSFWFLRITVPTQDSWGVHTVKNLVIE
jgi:hypothetical protein